jgi:hypothetical protein
MPRQPAGPTTYLEAQSRYRQITYQKGLLGDIDTPREVKKAGVFDATIEAIKKAFPDLSLSKDYTIPVEANDTERPATIEEIAALANSIPIPSLGAQGSTAPPLTTEGATTGIDSKTWLLIGIVGAVVLGAVFFMFRK